MRLLAYIDPIYKKEPVEYVLQFFSSCLGKPINRINEHELVTDDVVLVYSRNIPDNITHCQLAVHIRPSLFFTDEFYLKRKSLPIDLNYSNGLPWFVFHGQESLTAGQFPDLFANTFFLLTAYEELIECGTRDKRQRRVFSSSVLSQYSILDSPMIDQWLDRLQGFIADQTGMKFDKISWGNNKFAFVVTRDIDSLSKLSSFRWGAFIKAMFKGKPIQYLSSIKSVLFKQIDPYNNLEDIVEWELQNGIRSSNYFIASEDTGDANYSIEEVGKRKVIVTMKSGGWEIGFHPGAAAFQDRQQFALQKSRLEKAFNIRLQGGRQHGLRFNNPHTWRLWEENNLAYDSTVGFAEHEGFKAGTCRPFFIFDLIENKRLNLLEIPITLMDCTLDKYRHLSFEQMEEVCHQLLSKVIQFQGVFILLWHNTYFGVNNAGKYHDILKQLVRIAQDNQALITTASCVNTLWRERIKQLDLE